MSEMINLGGGKGSIGLTVYLVNKGWRGHIVFVDTGCEKPTTYCYLLYFEKEYLAPRGLSITRLSPGSPYHCSMAQMPLIDYCFAKKVIPLLAVRWCSARWKGRPLDKWAAAHDVTVQYIGFSADEAWRAEGKPPHQRFPLIDDHITRNGCDSIIYRAGLAVPESSHCWFCPGQTIAEWRSLYHGHADLYEQARQLEHLVSDEHDKHATLNNHLSLDEMLERGWPSEQEMDLSDWLPCACRL